MICKSVSASGAEGPQRFDVLLPAFGLVHSAESPATSETTCPHTWEAAIGMQELGSVSAPSAARASPYANDD